MGRSKATAQRRRAPQGRAPSSSIAQPVSPSSALEGNGLLVSPVAAVKEMEQNSSRIPEGLIEFLSREPSISEPPRKRQKTDTSSTRKEAADQDQGYTFITVNASYWDIKFSSSGLVGTPITRTDIRPLVQGSVRGFQYIQILNDLKKCVLHATIPENTDGLDDVLLALAVDKESGKWAKDEGRLWTDFEATLFSNNGEDIVRLAFTIKWNVTSKPENMFPSAKKPKALLRVLNRFFPNSNIREDDKWTPQDFYQSVHAPAKTDQVSSLEVPGLEANLFPFQKRAVQWLLQKEGVEWSEGAVKQHSRSRNTYELPISFIKAVDAHGKTCYVSHVFGLVTLDVAPYKALEDGLKGGILAEEMGLGKTVEMISLISLHRRPKEITIPVRDRFTGAELLPTAATLIIAPPSILQQWISEINRHAPSLNVMHYKGIKGHDTLNPSQLLEKLTMSDIVISTYATLSAEIHYTQLNPERSLRREPKYPRPKSPLMQLNWFRVCIDEAQMIESGVSNAAVVARLISRVNAWCITGTPVRKNVNDLLGLLIFLRLEPYASLKHVWSALISHHKYDFRRLFGSLALRHSKQSVRDELKLPAQRRYVITMPFTPIEEQHYQELFNQMCEDAGVDTQGAPLRDDWDPEAYTETMRRWLARLRQTALHPEVGGRNRRALGNKDGPLRTVDQVLDVMMEQTDVSIRTDQRTLLTTKLKRGQLFENSPRVREAFDIWTQAATEASDIVHECRQQLEHEVEQAKADEKEDKSSPISTENDDSDADDEIDPSSRIGVFRNRLRGALELEHMAIFFQANAYFQIKSNEDMTKPDSPEFLELEKLETEGYDKAKRLRREILQEIHRKAEKLIMTISKKAASQSFAQIPEFPTELPKGGIESRRSLEKLDALATILDGQANYLDEWREQAVQFLMRPLVDEDDGVEITGDEYEDSTKIQDEVMVFVQAIRTVIADRYDTLTGQVNKLVEHEAKSAVSLAKMGVGHAPEKTLELLGTREHLKPKTPIGSIREVISELRGLVISLRPDAEKGNTRAQNELSIVEKQLLITQRQLSEQTKAVTVLEKETELFTRVMNTRVEYYRQLQQVSDMVAPYEGPNNERVVEQLLKDEEKLARKIATAKAKRRYLEHLRTEAANPQEQRICVICRDSFEVGALTVCGHQYCKECIRLWWGSHRNCPVCKRKLIQADIHEITYKPQELSIEAEEVRVSLQPRATPRKSSIYSELSKVKFAEIKNIELSGPSFTTKVDTLARHIIWLRESDPGAKSIVYSQFKEFLDVLCQAFERYRIGYSSIDKPLGIERFKNDASVETFLLHARAHSSGLNLVNASHVFLCEPILNTALELQAIARVDRIGQHQETSVWLYLVDGTVEESVHQLSVKRRMEHMGRTPANDKGKSRERTPEELLDAKLEEANSLELQQASLTALLAKGSGGEMVMKEDLWECLFGGIAQKKVQKALVDSGIRDDPEVGRHLRAEAAEGRVAS